MKIIFILIIILLIPLSSAAHYIVGQANNASDGTGTNNLLVVIWNPSNGQVDNITDIIGPNGNSGSDNIYFADCELLNTPCKIGDTIAAKITYSSDGYSGQTVSLTVTGAGYDVMPDINWTKEITITNLTVDDTFTDPIGEIDLTPANTTIISCYGIIEGRNMDSLLDNITSEFFSNASSFYGDSDQNYKHYTNSSCNLNTGYGNSSQVYFNCTYNLQYYSKAGNWSCYIKSTKNTSITKTSFNNTYINSLLALELPDNINYGIVGSQQISSESVVNVTNYGNIGMNLSLTGYGASPGDNLAMNCSIGSNNISVNYEKYNLSISNTTSITLNNFNNYYINLSSNTVARNFSLDSRTNDISNDAIKSTYWRIYVPSGAAGNCSGKIIFGAINSAGN